MTMHRDIEGHLRIDLDEGWEMAATEPGGAADPAALEAIAPYWIPAPVPGTAASALRAHGTWSLDGPAFRFDAQDYWYRCRFKTPLLAAGESLTLCFDGLATIADAWLNGRHLLRSENMFVAQECHVPAAASAHHELHIRFSSLDALLSARRPRPRWRTPMVDHQQLRWFRTTLLGRMPGWAPPVAPVGPWRPVRLERRTGFTVRGVRVRPRIEGASGLLEAEIELQPIAGAHITAGRVCVTRADQRYEAHCDVRAGEAGSSILQATVWIPEIALWWPHTHGDQPLYDVLIRVTVNGVEREIGCGRTGFRQIRVDTDRGAFALSVNGLPVFCRGACWTPPDVVALDAPLALMRQTILAARAAGMNMLRVGGTMIYETDAFYDLCDELGILVWQDFMFANMDYPETDAAFAAAVHEEAVQALAQWQGRPALAVLCGDSEGEQQAAMWGAPRAMWERSSVRTALAELCARWIPDVPYWPSSASGGAFPHQPNVGTTSYYGVGAYLRPIEDARRSQVRFASECLAFANVPDERTLAGMGRGQALRVHHATWKARTPRDLGAGWDFDDVRDHYLERLFRVDPVRLRSIDHERYLELSRVATGEVMAAALCEWRRRESKCRGALIWFLRDPWAGAGWGLLDASGRPKAAYHFVRRALQPVLLFLTDEGLNGTHVHVVNEHSEPLVAELNIDFYRRGAIRVGGGSAEIMVPARGVVEQSVASLLPGFTDTTHAYQFGPPALDLVAATLRDHSGTLLADAFQFPLGLPAEQEEDIGLEVLPDALPDGGWELTVRARRFAQSIALDVGDLVPSDNFFHLPPGGSRTVRLSSGEGPAPAQGRGKALNAGGVVTFALAHDHTGAEEKPHHAREEHATPALPR